MAGSLGSVARADREGRDSRDASVQLASLRARRAVVLVSAAGLLQVGNELVTGLDARDSLPAMAPWPSSLALVSGVTWMTAAVLFLMWVHRAVLNANWFGAPMRWSPAQAVTGYVIPFLNIVRPYQVMIALHRASDPSHLPDAPRFRDRQDANYRDGAREVLEPLRWIRPAPIAAWWTVYMIHGLAGGLLVLSAGRTIGMMASAAGSALTCVLCVLVVRSIDARQRELARRLDAAGPTVTL